MIKVSLVKNIKWFLGKYTKEERIGALNYTIGVLEKQRFADRRAILRVRAKWRLCGGL